MPAAVDSATADTPFQWFGADGLTFRDVLDLINPIQHIPLLGNLYRRLTGDIIDPAIRIAGGALYGGALGAGFAAVALAVKTFGEEGGAMIESPGPAPGHHFETRGGWMVAASRSIEAPDAAEAGIAASAEPLPDNPTERRGGWMVQAAYGPVALPLARAKLDTHA